MNLYHLPIAATVVKSIVPALLILLLVSTLPGCKKEPLKVAPTVTMTSVTNITSVSASTGGNVTADGGASVTSRGICWSATNKTPTTADGNVSNGSGLGSFTSSITGLSPGTAYFVNASATNSIGTSYSSTSTFTTLALAPTITTAELTNITSNTATSGGTIPNDGGSPVTARGVCWSTSQNPTIADSKTTDGTGTGNFTSNLTNLKTGTTYNVRAYATNNIGTTYGNQVTTYSKEENILFTVSPDNSNGVITTSSETIEFKINVSTSIPQQGMIYSLDLKRTDTNASVFKLDSTSVQSNMTIKVPGFNFANNFSLTISVSSKSTSTNRLSKVILVSNPLALFQGYKVQQFPQMEEPQYWRDCGVMWDVIANKFLINVNGQPGSFFFPQLIAGDFNKDGWIDVFDPGTGSYAGKVADNTQWLIWNPVSKTFDNKNLFNNKLKNFGGNQRRSISVDLNHDGYTDVVIFDPGDDVSANWREVVQPLRIVLSDGKGSYDLKEINPTDIIDYFHSGDIADIDGDGNYDIVCACNDRVYICWGISDFPYFSKAKIILDARNQNLPLWMQEASGGTFNATIGDINNDGKNDIVLGGSENYAQPNSSLNSYNFYITTKILINKGNRVFDSSSLIKLPAFDPNKLVSGYIPSDFRICDINNDGLQDILTTYSIGYDDWGIFAYIQKSPGQFVVDTSIIQYTTNTNRHAGQYGSSWKPWLIYYDFNKDGIKDISYIDPHNFWDTSLRRKSVFINRGNTFVEEDFYQYDTFCKGIKP